MAKWRDGKVAKRHCFLVRPLCCRLQADPLSDWQLFAACNKIQNAEPGATPTDLRPRGFG